jgi:hypothetical protein
MKEALEKNLLKLEFRAKATIWIKPDKEECRKKIIPPETFFHVTGYRIVLNNKNQHNSHSSGSAKHVG